ncbi:MAG: AAA family ATPase [Pseudomonadales bacterium]|jgi:ATP-dependent Lon protease|nr:AAA family ATPase [Pseudomonadales bacterium]
MSNIDPKEVLSREVLELREKIDSAAIPDPIKDKARREIVALERSLEFGTYDEKYEKVSRYINWLLKVPWNLETRDNLDVERAKEIFEKHHYGMQEVKNRFIEYISMLNLQQKQNSTQQYRAPILLLVGLVGTGKTTFAYSLAEALGRKLVRIPFGGMGSARELRGYTRLDLEAEPGKVVGGLCEVGVRNPIILLDEIDRPAEDARMDIMGVLVELLDPAQNHAFIDNYIDYPVNLSRAIFLATANNTVNIATAVYDRMEKISMPSYSDQEKLMIAKKYIVPKLLKSAGLKPEQIIIDESLWPKIIRPLGYDMGIRTLERTLETAIRKAVRIMVERGFNEVYITPENSKIFLPQY